jgi:hypothetical protein
MVKRLKLGSVIQSNALVIGLSNKFKNVAAANRRGVTPKVNKNIPPGDRISMLPGEDLFNYTTGRHLHFSLNVSGASLIPTGFLRRMDTQAIFTQITESAGDSTRTLFFNRWRPTITDRVRYAILFFGVITPDFKRQ